MTLNPPPAAKFAVVLHPGTLFEQVDQYCSTLRGAQDLAHELRLDDPDTAVDVMRVIRPNGRAALTTDI